MCRKIKERVTKEDEGELNAGLMGEAACEKQSREIFDTESEAATFAPRLNSYLASLHQLQLLAVESPSSKT
jgi:hypothetical protein